MCLVSTITRIRPSEVILVDYPAKPNADRGEYSEEPAAADCATSSFRLSLLNLFEVVLAYGLIFAVDRFAHQVLGWNAGSLMILGCMYPFKIALATAAKKRRLLSLIGYACLAAATVAWPIQQEWSNVHVTWIGLFICVPISFLTLPTITFFMDIVATKPRSPRFLIWRSVLEIAVIFPPWLYISAFMSLFMGGVWI